MELRQMSVSTCSTSGSGATFLSDQELHFHVNRLAMEAIVTAEYLTFNSLEVLSVDIAGSLVMQ
jgi:hypothetical protein